MSKPPSSTAKLPGRLSEYRGPERRNRRADDQGWIEVITQMDRIYADLVHYQVELERKNADLEDAQRFIQSVISSISDVLIVCDINGQVQKVNPALLEAVGQEDEFILGQPLKQLFAPEYHALIDGFPDHIRSDTVIDCEVSLQDSSGQPFPLAVNCSPRYDHDNRLSGFVITGRPLGELQKAYRDLQEAHETLKTTQQQLLQSEKMASLGRLVAGVAHELNNPISFLYGNMHALADYEKKLRQYLDAIHDGIDEDAREALRKELRIDFLMTDMGPLVEGSLEGAERISSIVQNLRRFSMPQQQDPESFDLVPVIERALTWVLKASSRPPRIERHLPETLPLVNNEGHVHQILINLLQNAVDALQDTGEPVIRISAGQQDELAWIEVEDNGPGIAPEHVSRVFDPFFTTKPVGSGTGLGLYISYGLATEQCGGNLSFEHTEPGSARFRLELPLERRT